jgi:GNAT superfamily N-acetyltransferase
MDLGIRKYEDQDFESVTRLWRRAREVSLPEFQREKGYSFESDQKYFKEHILVEERVFIAELDRQMAGFMAIKGDFVDCLYVDPDHWHKGIGSALLDYARSLSSQHLWLYTLQINHVARNFYQKRGFVATKFGISPPPESEPDVEYHWSPNM